MSLNVSNYLLGLGISTLFNIITMILTQIAAKYDAKHCLDILSWIWLILNLFGLAWFVVGGIILFRSDVIRIQESVSSTIAYIARM